MSIPGSHSLWEEKEEELRVCTRQEGYTYTVPDGLLEEDSFQSRFEDLAVGSKVSKRNLLHLFTKLYGSYSSIIKISQGISKPGPDNGRPESLIWKTSLAALELGSQHGVSFDKVINLQVTLNETVPKLDNVVSNLERWSSFQPLQDKLKEMCKNFIGLYMDLIKAYGTKSFQPHENLRSYKPFETIIEKARDCFRDAENSYKQFIIEAEESEETGSAGSSDASSIPLTEFRLEFEKSQKPIGKKGSHGKVYLVKEKTTQELYACKVVKWSKKGRSQIAAKDEILILKRLRHTHIVTISAYSQVENKFKIFMQPLADSDLEVFLTDCAEKDFPADKTKMILPWFACLLHALAFAHHSKVKHRDIKPANILLKGDHIYLSDFSLAVDFADMDASVAIDEKAKGNLKYRAPETKGNVAGHRKADVFSLGCVYSEMLTVVCGRPVKDFCESRKNKLFCDNLLAVREWLQELRKQSPNDEKEKVINMCKVIKYMLEEEKDMRHSAHQALILVEENAELRCKHMH